jgi:hypothetical protein
LIALAGLALTALSALRLAHITVLVSVPATMFLCVYLSCTASATRLLAGKTRAAAAVAVLAVLAVLAFSGWTALLAAGVVAALAPALGRTIGQTAHFDELEAEPQDAVERAVQGRLVHLADQDGVDTVDFDTEVAECVTADLTETTSDGDPIAVRAHVFLRLGTGDQHGNYAWSTMERLPRQRLPIPERHTYISRLQRSQGGVLPDLLVTG